MSRREVLALLAIMSVAARLPVRAARLGPVGVQLFSVRDQLGTDPEPVIAALSKIGFSDVEVWFPTENAPSVTGLRRALDSHDMKAPSRHCRIRDLGGDGFPRLLAECEELGTTVLVLAALPPEQRGKLESYKRAADAFTQWGRTTRDRGVQFAFHTEPWDFAPLVGQVPFDYLIQHTDPELVRFQVDTANILQGGGNLLPYFGRLGRRIVSVHLKDVTTAGEATTLGNGAVAVKDVLRLASAAGVRQFFVEDGRPGLGYTHVAAAYAFLRGVEY